MIREVVKIDEDLCNGCGKCIPACHEGALQIIDGKARLISDLMCDGLGACLGHCPADAISTEKREAEPYDEIKVMKIMVSKGANTVTAHLQHLKEHNEIHYLKEAVQYLDSIKKDLPFRLEDVLDKVHNTNTRQTKADGCPGTKERSFKSVELTIDSKDTINYRSELRQWPVQMHLIHSGASHFQNADVVLAADCAAFAMGNFHQKILKGKSLAIACPKLDTQQKSYVSKIQSLIDDAKINSLTVVMMEVPCCGGLVQRVKSALMQTDRKIPVKTIIVGIEGNVLQEKTLES